MANDMISDMLTRLRNGNLAKHETVVVPFSKLAQQMCELLKKDGFIESFHLIPSRPLPLPHPGQGKGKGQNSSSSSVRNQNTQEPRSEIKDKKTEKAALQIGLKYSGRDKIPCITNLRRISKPGLRVYVNSRKVPRLLAGRCLVVISTSQGVMSDRQARELGLGGEVLCAVW